MGYETTYSLTWDKLDDNTRDEDIVDAFSKIPYFDGGGFTDHQDNIMVYGARWYDDDDDMYELSKKFPNVIFHLWGDGDASEDLWEVHWHNGKYQVCQAEIPPFDPNKLREYHSDGDQ